MDAVGRSFDRRARRPEFSVYKLAQLLVGIAHNFPGRVGQLVREFDVGIRPIDISDFGKDVLPLPRPSLDVYRQLQQGAQSLSRSKRKLVYQLAAVELWTYLAVMGLRFMYVGSRGVSHWWACKSTAPGQLTALATLRSRSEHFCRDAVDADLYYRC